MKRQLMIVAVMAFMAAITFATMWLLDNYPVESIKCMVVAAGATVFYVFASRVVDAASDHRSK